MKSAFRSLAALALLALAACNGNTLVTLTATPASITGFLTYRVKVVSVSVTEAKGGSTVSLLPHPVTIDLAQVTALSEILTDSALKKGDYTSVSVSVDYSDAMIIADTGTAEGVVLTPQDASGKSMGQVSLTLALDPSNPLSISTGSTSQLSLDFRLSASNNVNTTTKVVVVTPVLVASASPMDNKTVRIRGYLKSLDTTNSTYSTGIEPADGLVTAGGSVGVAPTSSTAYEINGVPSIGGYSTLSALSPGAWTVAYGTLSTTSSTQLSTTAATTSTITGSTGLLGAGTTGSSTSTTTSTLVTNIAFTPTQILAGDSVQGGSYDVVSGVVTSRNGNILTVPTATWITNAGVPAVTTGTATITIGTNTAVLTLGQAAGLTTNSYLQVSVGSTITAFGTATSTGGGNLSLDATNGRVRTANTVAAGTLVDSSVTGFVTVDLASLGGRQIGAFDFTGTNADHTNYLVDISGLALSTGDVSGDPLQLTGRVANFAAVPTYDFLATSLTDSTAVTAELVLDWGTAGSVAPFAAISSSQLDLPISTAGTRHQITVGQTQAALPAQVLIVPSTSSTLVYSIAHASTSTVENFNTFAAFATALAAALDGKTVATSITAEGLYTQSGTTLTATGIIVSLNL